MNTNNCEPENNFLAGCIMLIVGMMMFPPLGIIAVDFWFQALCSHGEKFACGTVHIIEWRIPSTNK